MTAQDQRGAERAVPEDGTSSWWTSRSRFGKTLDGLLRFPALSPVHSLTPTDLDPPRYSSHSLAKSLLVDEVSPDTCRLWDATTNEKLDKDRFRRDLARSAEAYEEILARLKKLPPKMMEVIRDRELHEVRGVRHLRVPDAASLTY